jgi:hypothetical protein
VVANRRRSAIARSSHGMIKDGFDEAIALCMDDRGRNPR